MTNRHCFGGEIIINLPKNYLDLSDSLPVPDNQNVYSNEKGTCLVLEFVQPVYITDDQAAQFYYKDLAEWNDGVADSATPQQVNSFLSSDVNYSTMIRGKQTCKKKGSSQEIPVYVSLLVLRFSTADLLISLTSETEEEQGIWDNVVQSLQFKNITNLLPKE